MVPKDSRLCSVISISVKPSVSSAVSVEPRRLQHPVNPDERDVADLQVQVARAALHRVAEQVVDVHDGLAILVANLRPSIP